MRDVAVFGGGLHVTLDHAEAGALLVKSRLAASGIPDPEMLPG